MKKMSLKIFKLHSLLWKELPMNHFLLSAYDIKGLISFSVCQDTNAVEQKKKKKTYNRKNIDASTKNMNTLNGRSN